MTEAPVKTARGIHVYNSSALGLVVCAHEHNRVMGELERENAALRDFARECRDNFDCDTGVNGSHPHYCRCCNAAKLIGPKA